MMRALLPLIRRDIGAAWSGGGLWLPVIFLILVASLYPFAVGPGRQVARANRWRNAVDRGAARQRCCRSSG
jgi:ABC-type transport system involved in cytochrome c biogenesis permease component